MKKCIPSAVILIILTIESRADEQSYKNNLITTYDPGQTSSVSSIFPRLQNYGEITTNQQYDDHPENKSYVRFEGQAPERPVKFEDDKKGQESIDKANPSTLLVDVSFDDKKDFHQNDRISNTGYEGESKNKIKFEGNNDEEDNYDDEEATDEEDEPETSSSQVVFEDDGKADGDDSDYADQHVSEREITDKPIKFENQDNEPNTKNRDSERNTVTERVVFKDDSNSNQRPVQKRKRKQRRFEGKPSNLAPTAPNSPHPGLGYPGYPGVGYPGTGYPGPGDPNAAYAGYPTPGYPPHRYPYPNYPSSYGISYPTPAYPGYSPYPGVYPSLSQGYGTYPTPGYQVPGDQRPMAGPTPYPSSGQGDPNGHSDTRYPGQEYAGSQSPVAPPPTAPQNGHPGPAYPGPEYPYYQGYPVPGYPPQYPADPNAQYPSQNQVQYRPPVYPGPHQPGYPPASQRPSRRPKSLTQRAVSAVAEALTSIALYDDQQCVPRILCEMAGSSTSSSPSLVKASASLQPLLSLLQTYNGVNSSPLFIFGHAAVTGMTAKGNPSACYRAYPKCPTDPEKLINYLNNHNGGFFRFFGLPEKPQQPHNLEQFYSYLSGQNNLPQKPQQQQQNYGFQRPHGYGFPPQNPYAYPYNYAHNYYNKQISYRSGKDVDSEAEARIQNKPAVNILAEEEIDSVPNESQDQGSKWAFPEDGSNKRGNNRDRNKVKKQKKRPSQSNRQKESERPSRGSKILKFPDDRSDDRREIQTIRDYPREQKHIFFPGQSNFQITTHYQTTTPVNPEEYYFDHKHNFYVKKPKALKTDDVVYVVRGNGDPNHPEVVRVKPGQSV